MARQIIRKATKSLGSRIDTFTSVFLLTAEISDQKLEAENDQGGSSTNHFATDYKESAT